MDISEQSYTAITSVLREAVGKYKGGEKDSVVTDIHVQPNSESGELLVFDDDDKELARTIIDEWVDCESEDFYKVAAPILRRALNALKDEGAFEGLSLMTPFSFVLVDDDKETVTELLLMDDDTALLNGDLLKGLDEDLDSFLKNLLEK